MCRADREISASDISKIARFCNVKESSVIQGLDARSIYDVPLAYHKEGMDTEVLRHFGLDAGAADLSRLGRYFGNLSQSGWSREYSRGWEIYCSAIRL